MIKPTTIFFDINETLLDLEPVKASVSQALGGRSDLLPLWFSTLLHYSLVDTMTDHYRDFFQIGVAALIMLGEKQGLDIDRATAEAAVIEPFRKLPPHADVRPSLKTLSGAGIELVCLGNNSADGITELFTHAGIIDYFRHRISTEEVRAFKPDPRPYAHALRVAGARPADVLMVAAHAWDLIGAKKAGLQTAFIRRPGSTLYPNVSRPDYVVDNLEELTSLLVN
ncbi:MAG: haloacid dehalogenase type II [Alphaproteobacteria bacterium]